VVTVVVALAPTIRLLRQVLLELSTLAVVVVVAMSTIPAMAAVAVLV
jgi:hypothetical protein